MIKNEWRYYNHAMLPVGAPHEEVNTEAIANGEIWKNCNRGGIRYLLDGQVIMIVGMKLNGGM